MESLCDAPGNLNVVINSTPLHPLPLLIYNSIFGFFYVEETAGTTLVQPENLAQESEESVKKEEDGFFCVPLEPVSQTNNATYIKPVVPKVNKPTPPSVESKTLPKLKYEKPEWSSQPPAVSGESELDEEGFCNHYYLEVKSFYFAGDS